MTTTGQSAADAPLVAVAIVTPHMEIIAMEITLADGTLVRFTQKAATYKQGDKVITEPPAPWEDVVKLAERAKTNDVVIVGIGQPNGNEVTL